MTALAWLDLLVAERRANRHEWATLHRYRRRVAAIAAQRDRAPFFAGIERFAVEVDLVQQVQALAMFRAYRTLPLVRAQRWHLQRLDEAGGV